LKERIDHKQRSVLLSEINHYCSTVSYLRDLGNTLIVVEHDEDTIRNADFVVDMGPGAGRCGGHIVAHGTPKQVLKTDSLTAQYLNEKKQIPVPSQRRKGNGKFLTIHGARGNNLKNITGESGTELLYLEEADYTDRPLTFCSGSPTNKSE